MSPTRRERNVLVTAARRIEGMILEVERELDRLQQTPGASTSWQYAHHALSHLREAASGLWLASQGKGGGDAGT